jgi:DNA-binding NarL/FixJ family response regulator
MFAPPRTVAPPRRGPRVTDLSPSELLVLELVAADLTNAEIAARLGKRPATVKLQVAAIIHKLGVSSRVGAAVWYVSQRYSSTQSSLPSL